MLVIDGLAHEQHSLTKGIQSGLGHHQGAGRVEGRRQLAAGTRDVGDEQAAVRVELGAVHVRCTHQFVAVETADHVAAPDEGQDSDVVDARAFHEAAGTETEDA